MKNYVKFNYYFPAVFSLVIGSCCILNAVGNLSQHIAAALIGTLLIAISVGFIAKGLSRQHRIENLKRNGKRIIADFAGYESVGANGKRQRLVCTYVRPGSNHEHMFYSDAIFIPGALENILMGVPVNVYLNGDDYHDYYVDTAPFEKNKKK